MESFKKYMLEMQGQRNLMGDKPKYIFDPPGDKAYSIYVLKRIVNNQGILEQKMIDKIMPKFGFQITDESTNSKPYYNLNLYPNKKLQYRYEPMSLSLLNRNHGIKMSPHADPVNCAMMFQLAEYNEDYKKYLWERFIIQINDTEVKNLWIIDSDKSNASPTIQATHIWGENAPVHRDKNGDVNIPKLKDIITIYETGNDPSWTPKKDPNYMPKDSSKWTKKELLDLARDNNSAFGRVLNRTSNWDTFLNYDGPKKDLEPKDSEELKAYQERMAKIQKRSDYHYNKPHMKDIAKKFDAAVKDKFNKKS